MWSAPPELARRLAQIGVVSRADGPQLAKLLKPGQRLVSPEGDLWRWDGFWVAANAPTGAARRLAERNRLTDIESELTQRAGRGRDASPSGVAPPKPNRSLRSAGRDTGANCAGASCSTPPTPLASAMPLPSASRARIAARQSALGEAKTRLEAALADVQARRDEAAGALAALPALETLNADLAEIRIRVGSDRTAFAEARAQAQALAREVELAERRIAAIAAEANAWREREGSAAAQIATARSAHRRNA